MSERITALIGSRFILYLFNILNTLYIVMLRRRRKNFLCI